MTPDGLPDDRITCATCTSFDQESRWCRALKVRTVADVPFRCMSYTPAYGEPDTRTGRERWPTLKADIAAARAFGDGRTKP